MIILDNTISLNESKVLVENERVKIEQLKIAEDFSTNTITVMPFQEYSFTSRSGIMTPMIGTGIISNGIDTVNMQRGTRVGVSRNEKITITNQAQFPLTINFVSAN